MDGNLNGPPDISNMAENDVGGIEDGFQPVTPVTIGFDGTGKVGWIGAGIIRGMDLDWLDKYSFQLGGGWYGMVRRTGRNTCFGSAMISIQFLKEKCSSLGFGNCLVHNI